MNILFLGYDAWGDWISYNGLIRYLAEKYDKVYIQLDYGTARKSFVNDLFKDNKLLALKVFVLAATNAVFATTFCANLLT